MLPVTVKEALRRPQAWLSQKQAQHGRLYNLWRAKWQGCSWDALPIPEAFVLLLSETKQESPIYIKPFHVLHFLFVGKGLQPPRPSWIPRGIFKQLLIRGWGNAETKEQQSRNNNAAKKQGPGSYSRDIHKNVSLSSSAGTKAPTQVEDGYPRLSTTVLEHCPVTSLSTSQKKFTVCSPYLKFCLKKLFPENHQGVEFFAYKPSVLLAWPYNKPFPLQTLMFWFVWPHGTSDTWMWLWEHLQLQYIISHLF